MRRKDKVEKSQYPYSSNNSHLKDTYILSDFSQITLLLLRLSSLTLVTSCFFLLFLFFLLLVFVSILVRLGAYIICVNCGITYCILIELFFYFRRSISILRNAIDRLLFIQVRAELRNRIQRALESRMILLAVFGPRVDYRPGLFKALDGSGSFDDLGVVLHDLSLAARQVGRIEEDVGLIVSDQYDLYQAVEVWTTEALSVLL